MTGKYGKVPLPVVRRKKNQRVAARQRRSPPVYAQTEELGSRIPTTGDGIGCGSVLYWPHYYYYYYYYYYYRPGASAP